MRIGIDTESLNYSSIGVKILTSNLISGLKQLNQKMTCFQSPTPHPLKGVEYHYFRKPISFPFSHSLAALTRNSCYQKVDLIHFTVPKILYLKKPKIPFVLTIHDLTPLLYPQFVSHKNYWYTKCFLGKYLKEAHALVAISENTKHDLLKYFKIPEEKIHVIHNAILPQKQVLCFEKRPYLLYVGSFEPRKNLKKIFEAFSIVKGKGVKATFIFAGCESRLHPFPWNLAEYYGVEKEVEFLGFVSEEKKAELYRNASLLVWPSFYEGFGYPLLEAMHYGTPIVTSKGSSIEEIVGDAAVCVNPCRAEEIAEGIASVLTSPAFSRQLILKGVERAKFFSLEKMAKQYLKVYESTLY